MFLEGFVLVLKGFRLVVAVLKVFLNLILKPLGFFVDALEGWYVDFANFFKVLASA